jgi:hypothetical protein
MKLLSKDLIEINKSMSDIPRELEWGNRGEGKYENLSEEIDCNGFLIVFELEINGSAQKLTTSGFMEENIYSEPKYTIVISNIKVYNSDGEKLTMLDKHERSLNHNLTLNIYPC